MSETRQDIEKRARNAILQEAFFRFESALTLSGMLVATVVDPARWWLYLPLGIVIELFIAFRTLRNPKINAKAVAQAFERKYQPKSLKSKDLTATVHKAVEYLQQVETAVLASKEGPMRDRLDRTTDEMVDWVEGIYRLASRLDAYRQDEVIKRDLISVPEAIRSLRERLIETPDPAMRPQIEEAIRDRESQLASLQKLDNTMQNADLLLERNLSDMGRVYSQVHLMSSLREVEGKEADLQSEISEHVHQLDDLVEAMDEFHGNRRRFQGEALRQASY